VPVVIVDRAALARKYRTLLALRTTPDRSALAGLAAEFPGALRELDELPAGELERRIAELDAAAPLRPELAAIARFHELLLTRAGEPRQVGRKPSREALALLARELGLGELETHRLVFPYAHVRRGF